MKTMGKIRKRELTVNSWTHEGKVIKYLKSNDLNDENSSTRENEL